MTIQFDRPEIIESETHGREVPKKSLSIRKDMAATLRLRTALRAGVQLSGQPQENGASF